MVATRHHRGISTYVLWFVLDIFLWAVFCGCSLLHCHITIWKTRISASPCQGWVSKARYRWCGDYYIEAVKCLKMGMTDPDSFTRCMWKGFLTFHHSNKVVVGSCTTYTILYNNTCVLWSPWCMNHLAYSLHQFWSSSWMLELCSSGRSIPKSQQMFLTLMIYWSLWIYEHRPLSMQ